MNKITKNIVLLLLPIIGILLVFNILWTPNKNELEIATNDIHYTPTKWGFEAIGSNTAKIIHSEVLTDDTSLKLSIFFTDIGCQYCIEYEVKKVNELYKNSPNNVKIYLLSNNSSYLERLYGAKFPYKLINLDEPLLDNNFEFDNPVAIFSDANNVVQIIHIAEKNKELKSDIFYKRIESLLQSFN